MLDQLTACCAKSKNDFIAVEHRAYPDPLLQYALQQGFPLSLELSGVHKLGDPGLDAVSVLRKISEAAFCVLGHGYVDF